MIKTRVMLVAVFVLMGTADAQAHEFWISPQSYMVDAAARIIADIRVGQNFIGNDLAYLPFALTRFDLVSARETRAMGGRLGDIPAIDTEAPAAAGLVTIAVATTGTTVEYKDMDMFATFLESKGLEEFIDQHRARGLPEAGFIEFYRRFAKSLVAVGDGAGEDSPLGLEAEIVAGANPYADDVSGGLEVEVLYRDAPRAGAELHVFARDAAGEVTHTTVLTDTDGRASVPVTAGSEYLLDTVVMRPAPPSGEADAPVWQSLWASLTFMVPGPGPN
jgi:hypothetical protein